MTSIAKTKVIVCLIILKVAMKTVYSSVKPVVEKELVNTVKMYTKRNPQTLKM